MSEIELSNDKAEKIPIEIEEGFFLVLASTAMVELIPDYRMRYGIDNGLSADAASAMGWPGR